MSPEHLSRQIDDKSNSFSFEIDFRKSSVTLQQTKLISFIVDLLDSITSRTTFKYNSGIYEKHNLFRFGPKMDNI